MAKKPTVTTLASGFNSTETLNANFENVKESFGNTLSLDGSTPNAMEATLDLNNNDIVNAGAVGASSLIVNGKLIAVSNDPVFDGTVTTFGASLIDDADAAAARTTLGLGTASTAASADFVAVSGASMTGDLSFGDNDKAIFGAGSDLQIYHSGSGSYISDQGVGPLNLLSGGVRLKDTTDTETMLAANSGGSVTVYYDNAPKLATTSTGINVTGTVNATSYTGDGSNLTGIPAPALEIIAYARVSNATTNPLTVDFSTGFSSMARTNTGNYTFTFSSARSSVDYMVFCQCASGTISRTQAVNTQSATSFDVDTRIISSGGLADQDFNVIVYALPS